jgi:hypothetical protein
MLLNIILCPAKGIHELRYAVTLIKILNFFENRDVMEFGLTSTLVDKFGPQSSLTRVAKTQNNLS